MSEAPFIREAPFVHEQLYWLLGPIMLAVAQVGAIAIGIVRGGFKCGELKRTVEFKLNRNALGATWAQMHGRLMELGFADADENGRYLQSGGTSGDPGNFTHARTAKELAVSFQDTGAEINASLTLRYLTFIVFDSGESAYRDALLNYVSGQVDRMLVVPNLSLLAMTCLTSGALAVPVVVFIHVSGFRDLLGVAMVTPVTSILVGLTALFFIWQKPREISGKSLVFTGIALSAAALVMAFVR
jgi:hypothetical protein